MKNKIKELKLQGKGTREIAKELNLNRRTIQNYLRKLEMANVPRVKLTDEKVGNEIAIKYSKYEYLGGYINGDSYIYLMCKDCGHIFKRTAQIIRPSRIYSVECTNCNTIIRNINKKQKQLEKQKNKLIREQKRKEKEKEKESLRIQLLKEKEQTKICGECGEKFTTTKNSIYCSADCMKKANDRRKSLRKRKKVMTNGDVDWGISLTKLIKKEKNICHICGQKCDRSDYQINENGIFIAGNKYPSVDHVQPIAKGGTHTWDNVRLAHCQCNSIKSDKIIYEDKYKQLIMAI